MVRSIPFTLLTPFALLTLWLTTSAISVSGETIRRADELLPESTAAMLSLEDRGLAETKWEQTQLGHLVTMPQLEPFVDQVRQRVQGELHEMVEYLGRSGCCLLANRF